MKPANVRVTPDGRAKVLDFGLAKAVAPTSGPPKPADSMTATGVIVGTPSYMSPEQSRGQAVDVRTDLWAFGCLLYEMLTGKKAFGGASVPDIFAAVLHDEPDWKLLPRTTNASVRRLLQRCLEKEPEKRIGDAREVLAAIREASAPKPRRPRMPSGVTEAPRRLAQITLSRGLEESPVFSPSGDEMAYAADRGGVRKICLRRASGGEERALTSGPFDDIQPSFSPDGASIVFVRSHMPAASWSLATSSACTDGGDVWSIDLGNGTESKVVDNAYGPAYSPDGRWLAVDASWAGPRRIWIVDRGGHNPRQVSSDESEAVSHLMPRWSPNGTALVFTNKEPTTFDIKVAIVATGATQWVTHDAVLDVYPTWSPAGDAIYFSSQRGGGINLWRMPVDAAGLPHGPARQLTTGAGQDVEVAISPDGHRLAFVTLKQNADLWQLPVSPGSGAATGPPRQVVATSREDSRGEWSRDGRSVAFNSDRAENMNIWLHAFDGSADRQLTRGPGGDYQPTWSPDGRTLVFFSSRAGTADIWSVDVQNATLTRLTDSPSLEINPRVSPDGRFVAYQSDRDGRMAPWVMLADGSGQRQLAGLTVAGHFLQWSPDGTRVIVRQSGTGASGLATLVQVPVDKGPVEPYAEVAGGSHFSTSPDHSRVIDVVGHKALWLSRRGGVAPVKLFAFDEPDARIDYPQWSPDGRAVLFDRFQPQGGDIWVMEGVE